MRILKQPKQIPTKSGWITKHKVIQPNFFI